MLNFDFSSLTPSTIATLASGMVISLQVAGTALGVGLVWGTVLAMMRLSRFRALSLVATVYVNLFRSVPLAMVLLSFYLIVPQVLRSLFNTATDTRLLSALVGFALFESAYYAEIIRAGIQSVPKGQLGAALALGMKPLQAMRIVVLPQAFKNMLPLLFTQLIALFQDTSLVYVISLSDFFTGAEGIGERDGRIEEMMIVAGAVYFIICFSASTLIKRLSAKGQLS
ncbi:ABC transporter permease subunit [Paraburkholderia sediminicola]|uniref:ABC transporter permease subunit n=1 Tax=Paraburkholderia rhynchosiae TaxID=487049 RepID=A0ACC7NKZ6_9BURK